MSKEEEKRTSVIYDDDDDDGDNNRPKPLLEEQIEPTDQSPPKQIEKDDNVTHSHSVPETETRSIYLNWQFLVVFVSISLGFHAAFLGSVNGWNGAQTTIPIALTIDPIQSLLATLSLPEISSGANLTRIAAGLNLTQMATGVNAAQVESNLDWDTLFWGLVHTNPKEFASGVNATGIAQEGIDLKGILSGINPAQVASGIQLREFLSGLNPRESVPAAYSEFPAAVSRLKQGLWIYPTLIFTQILSSVFFGRLSDYVGRRWIFLFGNLVSFAAFLATGRVNGGAEITGLSALIGIGTGIQVLGPWLALAELVPIRHRFTITGLCLSLLAPVVAIHVAVATAFLEHTDEGWRWSYYFNAILSFASFVGLFVAYHPPTYNQLHRHPVEEPPVKDWLGLTAFTVSIAMMTYALGWGKFIWVWGSPQVISILTISGVALVGFLVYEYNFGNDHHAYPAYLVRSYTHLSQMVVAGMGTLVWYFAPIAQLVDFVTVTPRFGMQGAWENLWGAGLAGGFILASILLIRPKYLKWHIVSGVVVEMLFLVALRGLELPDQYRRTMSFFFLSGLGLGYMTVVNYVTAPMTARKRDMGLIVGLVSAYRGLCFAVIRGVFLTLYVNQLIGNAQRIPLSAFKSLGPIPDTLKSILDGIASVQRTGTVTELLNLPVTTTMTDAVVSVFARSWHFVICLAYIYFFMVIFFALASPGTDGYLSDRVFVRLNRGGIRRISRSHRQEV